MYIFTRVGTMGLMHIQYLVIQYYSPLINDPIVELITFHFCGGRYACLLFTFAVIPIPAHRRR